MHKRPTLWMVLFQCFVFSVTLFHLFLPPNFSLCSFILHFSLFCLLFFYFLFPCHSCCPPLSSNFLFYLHITSSFLFCLSSATADVPLHHSSCLSWKMRNAVPYIISAGFTWSVCYVMSMHFNAIDQPQQLQFYADASCYVFLSVLKPEIKNPSNQTASVRIR